MKKLFYNKEKLEKISQQIITSLAEINKIDKNYFYWKIEVNPKNWPIEISISPKYDELCKKNIFPKYTFDIGTSFFIKTSFNDNKYLFIILIAYIPYFRERLDFEFKRWGWLSKFKSFDEFLTYIKRNWLIDNYELILLDKEKINILEKTAYTLYNDIKKAQSLLEDKVYLWTYSDLSKISFGVIEDFTDLKLEEIIRKIPILIRKATKIQDKLKEKYLIKEEKETIRIEVNPCMDRTLNLGLWVLASW